MPQLCHVSQPLAVARPPASRPASASSRTPPINARLATTFTARDKTPPQTGVRVSPSAYKHAVIWRVAATAHNPGAIACNAAAVASASAAENAPRWNSTVVTGTASAASPTAAGSMTTLTSRNANPRLSRRPAMSRRCACSAKLGSTAVPSAATNTPTGNSNSRLAYHSRATLPSASRDAICVPTTRLS